MTDGDTYERVIAESYDALYAKVRDPSGDVAFYLELARESGGPVLELGCGTGRTLLPIARTGLACVGLDASAAMLAELAKKSPPPNLEVVHGRMEDLDLGDARFRLVTAPFRALSHLLDVETQLACLARIRAHLLPGGVFAFDLFDPKLERMALLEEPETLAVSFLQDGHEARRYDTIRRDLTSQVMNVRFRFEGASLDGSTEIRMRWFYRYEVEHLLARAGFRDIRFHGDFNRGPWKAGSETIVLAAR